MPRFATVAVHLPVDDLGDRYRQAHDPVARSHWQIRWLVGQGRHRPAVARLVGSSPNWVREIIRRYNAAGPVGIGDRRLANRGQPPLLTPALRAPPPAGGLLDRPAGRDVDE